MTENIRVLVRCRPMSKKEKDSKCRNIIRIEDCVVVVQNPSDMSAPAKTFTYDSAYDAFASTEALYNDMCYSLVENVLEGYNGTIFAYGQTGCGKSHTMQGPDNGNNDAKQRQRTSLSSGGDGRGGIISRSFDHIFEAISVTSGVQYLALVSYLEIYNETIRDLLNPNEGANANHPLKELPAEGVIVPTLTTHAVHNANECDYLLSVGEKNRMVGATLMNAASSRSHSIFTISLEQINASAYSNANDSDGSNGKRLLASGIRKGKLNLVDLAGSERQHKTGASGDRLKEATKINLSLSALGNVISALVDGKTKHIPYRDSKLTRLLQDSLGGNTKTVMIACISPADYNYDETLSTLRYASRAKNISNKPKINEDPKDAMLRKYQEEIMKLKKMLHETAVSPGDDDDDNVVISVLDRRHHSHLDTALVEDERAKLQSEYEMETNRLREQHAVQQKEKEELVRDMEILRAHYEGKLKMLQSVEQQPPLNNAQGGIISDKVGATVTADAVLQMAARNRIDLIKNALIGGERANDVQLKEKRYKKKLAVQRRLSALAHVLNRVEQSEDRDFLQGHYTNIQQELNVKNESLKSYRHKVKSLEREVYDLQAEFQLDRADYLESIRRLERCLKFHQQLMEQALPILRKDGKLWDPDELMQRSTWNDDLKRWKLPEESMNSFRLPPATASAVTPIYSSVERLEIDDAAAAENDDAVARNFIVKSCEELQKSNQQTINDDICNNYFRPRRITSDGVGQQHKKDLAQHRNKQQQLLLFQKMQQIAMPTSMKFSKQPQEQQQPQVVHQQRQHLRSSWKKFSSAAYGSRSNRVLSSWLPQNHLSMSKTWCGLSSGTDGGLLSLPAVVPSADQRHQQIPIIIPNDDGHFATTKGQSATGSSFESRESNPTPHNEANVENG